MVEHHPIHNSEVYLLSGDAQRLTNPPPSPPSPPTPGATEPSSPIEDLCLEEDVLSQVDLSEQSVKLNERLAGAVHVLNTEATSLRKLTQLYETDAGAAAGFSSAVEAVTRFRGNKGKLVVIGVGKSGHISKKLVATFNSLGVHSSYLHPTEALHGDLGKIGQHDTILFVTFSGKTQELLLLLPYIDASLPTIVITSHTEPENCELIRQRPDMILVPAPIHEAETLSFGVSAPTTSTTMALAVGDALAVVASQELHASVAVLFGKNHPGGAIGATYSKPQKIRDIMVPVCEIPETATPPYATRGADILKAGYGSPSGWVQVGGLFASPARITALDCSKLGDLICDISQLAVGRDEFIAICADTRISQAAQWLRDMVVSSGDDCDEMSIVAVMDNEVVIGVMEAGQLLSWPE